MADTHSFTTEAGSVVTYDIDGDTLVYEMTLTMPNACFVMSPDYTEMEDKDILVRQHRIEQPFDICAQVITNVTASASITLDRIGDKDFEVLILGVENQELDKARIPFH